MVWIIKKFRSIRDSENCYVFARGFVEGIASPVNIWRYPIVSPPENEGIKGDWVNVGGYLTESLRKEKAKMNEPT